MSKSSLIAPCWAKGPRREGVREREKIMFVTCVSDEGEECWECVTSTGTTPAAKTDEQRAVTWSSSLRGLRLEGGFEALA